MAFDTAKEVTIAEAAEMTGLTKRAIARRIERGRLPARLKRDGRRYIQIQHLAESGLLDLATGKPAIWRGDHVDAQEIAKQLVQTLIRQGIELNELRQRLEALEDESRQQNKELLEQIEQARRERGELRRQLQRLKKA